MHPPPPPTLQKSHSSVEASPISLPPFEAGKLGNLIYEEALIEPFSRDARFVLEKFLRFGRALKGT